ncbi:MAG: hypothetical protein ACYCZP_15840, partial [Acidimicrobiales bacterium]
MATTKRATAPSRTRARPERNGEGGRRAAGSKKPEHAASRGGRARGAGGSRTGPAGGGVLSDHG